MRGARNGAAKEKFRGDLDRCKKLLSEGIHFLERANAISGREYSVESYLESLKAVRMAHGGLED